MSRGRNTELPGYCQIGFTAKFGVRPRFTPFLTTFSQLASASEMRRILLSTIKILISAALLYLALRKVNLYDLASRIHVESLG